MRFIFKRGNLIALWIWACWKNRHKQWAINLECSQLAATFNAFVRHAHNVIDKELEFRKSRRLAECLRNERDQLAEPLLDLCELIRTNSHSVEALWPLRKLFQLISSFDGHKATIEYQGQFCPLEELYDDLMNGLQRRRNAA